MKNIDGTPKMLDVLATASQLGLHPMSVYKLVRSQALSAVKVGRVWRIRQAAIDDFISKLTQVPR